MQKQIRPISELANDREACEKIAMLWKSKSVIDVILWKMAEIVQIRCYIGKQDILNICLHFDRSVSGYYENGDSFSVNPFAFVTLMNELGYGPIE